MEKKKDFFTKSGQVIYQTSGSSKFDTDMQAARKEGASIGEAGWQAFVLNKQNEMMLGNGSASPYARTSRISNMASTSRVGFSNFKNLDDLMRLFEGKNLSNVMDNLLKNGWTKVEGNWGVKSIFEKQIGKNRFLQFGN